MPNQQDDGQSSTLDDNRQEEAKPKATVVNQETLYKGKWLSFEKVTYQTAGGSQRTWEAVQRTTQHSNGMADAVAMVAVLKRLIHYDCIVLVKQFRPAVKSYTIEFPAGLIDQGENATDSALRELKEETGYSGTVQSVSPALSLDSGVSASTVSLVHMQIDGEDPVNLRPVPHLDDGEHVDVLLLPLHKLCKKLKDIATRNDCVIDSRVYTYAATLDAAMLAQSPKKIP